MSVTATIDQKLTAKETLVASDFPGISATATDGNSVTISGFNRSGARLSATSTPPIDALVADELTTDGADTIDLTAANTPLDPAADMTGKAVVAFLFSCPADNEDPIVVAPGASNPYPLFGTGNDIEIAPGGCVLVSYVGVASPLPAVSGTVKTLDVTGTSGDVLNYEIVLGTPAA